MAFLKILVINSPRGNSNSSVMDQVVACDASLQDDMGLILTLSHVFPSDLV